MSKKLTDLLTESNEREIDGKPGQSELMIEFEQCVCKGDTLREFLLRFDFDSLEEMVRGIKTILRCAATDKYYLANRKTLEGAANTIYARYAKVYNDAKACETFPNALANEVWNGGYSRQKRDNAMALLFDTAEYSVDAFNEAHEFLMKNYKLSEQDMEKLLFFVCQCKERRKFPNSLRRMLYIWGDKKKTGKTTSASCLVELLNADTGKYHNASGYCTTLTNEMQIGNFKVPLIASMNCCLMDECFYEDMGKTYADFKRFLTSSDGRARMPYGQEFQWYGLPNYIATSNDPLIKFIKDWGDRRYLAIEFKDSPAEDFVSFDAVKDHWKQFVVNAHRTKDWIEWANEIATFSDEMGERQEFAEEFAQELRQRAFLSFLLEKPEDSAKTSNNNKLRLKFFIDYFRTQCGYDVARKRSEIEKAVVDVFGERDQYGFWLLGDLKKTADELWRINCGVKPKTEAEKVDKNDTGECPF